MSSSLIAENGNVGTLVQIKPTEDVVTTEKLKELELIKDLISDCNAHANSIFEIQGLLRTEELPDEICTLTKARKIVCTSNFKLTKIPELISDLYEKLEILILSYNAIQEFPAAICQLKYLQKLDISNNFIRCLPTKIDQMKSLEKLTIDANFIMAFPYTLPHLKQLKTIYAENNPLLKEDDLNPADPPVDKTVTTCAVTGEALTTNIFHFVNFVDFAGIKRMPIHYVCGTEQARDLAIEEKDKEVVDYWSLKYHI